MMRIRRALIVTSLSCVTLASLPSEAFATPDDWWDTGWISRIDVTVTEPGIVDRNEEYVDLIIDFPPGSYSDLDAEVRAIDEMGTELPSLVHSLDANEAHVLVNMSVQNGASQTIHVYFGNDAAASPAYAFPDVPGIFYVANPAGLAGFEVNLEQNFEALSIFAQISMAIEIADGDTDYDQAVAQTLRAVFVSGNCSVTAALAATSVYDDVSIWGVSDGNCFEQNVYGLNDGSDPSDAQVPPTTDYLTQDFMPDQVLSFTCGEAATPNAGGVLELVSAADPTLGCVLSFDGGHGLPNGETLQYRSFFTGIVAPFDADATTIHERAVEFLLQENRVEVVLGRVESIDGDGDGVIDREDNCVDDENAEQADADADAIGDICDACPDDADNDADGDTICGDVDNCPDDANEDQADTDGNGVGDACEAAGDTMGGADTMGADGTGDGTGAVTNGPPTASAGSTGSGDDSGSGESAAGGNDDGGGCSCQSGGGPARSIAGLLFLLGLVGVTRRRAS